MINYYYEIEPGTKVFGHNYKYLAHLDAKPNDMFNQWRYFHDEAMKHSTRVWLENANGVRLIKTREYGDMSFGEVTDTREFFWIKLQCRDIETL